MQSCVVVLLKLLLSTVTGPGAQNPSLQNAMPPGFTSPAAEQLREPSNQDLADGSAPETLPPPTREEIDMARHREIMSKAVSAIILLIMKWFKASRKSKSHTTADNQMC